jgi:putative transposase
MVNVKIQENKFVRYYKMQIYPTKSQIETLDRYIDLSRYIYNWALNEVIENLVLYMNDGTDVQYLSRNDLERRFTKLRNSEEYSFLKEMPHISERMAIWRVADAINYYKKNVCNFPKYKRKKDKGNKSFGTRCDTTYFKNNKLRIEGFPKGEMIELSFDTKWDSTTFDHMYKPTITKRNDGTYWFSFGTIQTKHTTYFEENNIQRSNKAIGIDLNVDKRIQLSNGKVFKSPSIDKYINRFKRCQRKVSKDIKRNKELEKTNPITISKREIKRLRKYQKSNRKIADVVNNFIHTSTKQIINMAPSAVIMENLGTTDMKQNKYMSSLLSNTHSNFSKIREIMEYKCHKYGIKFILAPRWYPSSQLCSNCGNRQHIVRKRIYKCPKCGMVMDRDLNAAINLEKLAYV